MKKRLLSALLALVMVLALLPVSVFATQGEGGDTTPPETTVTTPETTPETPADPVTPAEPETPAAPVVPETPAAPVSNGASRMGADPGLDLTGKTKVTYYAKMQPDKATDDVGGYIDHPGWFYSWVDKSVTPNKTYYTEVTTGVINSVSTSGNWYPTPYGTNGKALTSFTLLNDAGLTTDGTSLNVDLNGHTLTLGGTEDNLTSLTLTDKLWTEYNNAAHPRGTLNWVISRSPSGGTKDTSKNLSIKGTNVRITSIALSNWATHNVNLTNCIVDSTIDMSGKTDNSSSQTLTLAQCQLGGKVTVTGNSSRVTFTDTTGGQDVDLTGTGASLTVNGVSNIGTVTLLATTDVTKKTAATPSVIVNAGTIATIADGAGEVSTNPYKVTINAQGVVGNINIDNGLTLNVNQGTVLGWVTMGKTSSVTITGPRANVGKGNALGTPVGSGGSIVFADGNKSILKVTGANNNIGDIICTGSAVNMTVDIAAEPTNIFGAVSLPGYTGGGIKGGKYVSVTPATALNSSLVYQLTKAGGLTGYYTLAQLANALDDQTYTTTTTTEADGSTTTSYTTADVLTFVGQDTSLTKHTLTFQNGSMIWGELDYYSQSAITLPTLVNGKPLQNWTATTAAGVVNTYPAGGRYLTPTPDTDVVLNAQSASADATKITNVTVKTAGTDPTANNVKVTLNGNVFTLTGAVTSVSGFARIMLEVTTDLVGNNGAPITVDVPVLYNNGLTTFGNATLKNGMVITPDFNALRLSNDTTYTLNGSGLHAIASLLHTDLDSTEIVATANIGGWTDLQKKALIDGLEGGQFTWNGSPAILQAINAAQATMSDSQIKNWITQAQRKYWTSQNNGNPTEQDLSSTGYDTLYLVPYLDVKVTFWNETGILNATLTPSYRVEVRSRFAPTPDVVGGGAHDPIVVKAGTSLGQLTGQMYASTTTTTGGVSNTTITGAPTVSFNLPSLNGLYLHQDNTYVYAAANATSASWTINHAGTNGLGAVVINDTAPLITMRNPVKIDHHENAADTADYTNAVVNRYDALQAAVDDTNHMAQITIESGYTGSCAINMTGAARTIYINAKGNNTITANGSGVTVTPDSTGHWYTVQLAYATTTTDSTTASITTVDVTNGAATVSAKSAKSGSAITVTATPNAGYRTSGVTVTAHNAKTNTNTTVPVTLTRENVYTFTVPAGATSITVTPAFAVNTSLTGMPFTDVALNNSYFEAVKYVYDNGLMNGNNTAGTLFDGNATLNRGMVVTILYRASGSPTVSSINAFKDVDSNAWYARAVTWANQNHIVEGYGNGNFGPTDAITREQLATILYRYNTSYKGRATTGSTTLVKYTDQGNVSDWATAGMQWAVGNGIVNGTTNTTLTPRGNATRYQAATMLMRYGKGFGL